MPDQKPILTEIAFAVDRPTKPRLLDLFCGAGGAAVGYARAGFQVMGVDIAEQPNYPFTFHAADALAVLEDVLTGDWPKFDAIHASPPCQRYTRYRRRPDRKQSTDERYEDFIEPARTLLRATGLPYVIENVESAPLVDPVMLCGSMFDGRGTHDIQRHRLFETNWPLEAPGVCDHSIWAPNRYTGGRSKMRGGPHVLCRKTIEIGKWGIPLETQKWAMGVDWDVTVRELSEAVPPAYTELIGTELSAYLAISSVAGTDCFPEEQVA